MVVIPLGLLTQLSLSTWNLELLAVEINPGDNRVAGATTKPWRTWLVGGTARPLVVSTFSRLVTVYIHLILAIHKVIGVSPRLRSTDRIRLMASLLYSRRSLALLHVVHCSKTGYLLTYRLVS